MADSGQRGEGLSLYHIILQISLMCVVLHLWSSPLIQPLKLMVVLFHEISHGLVALATGGKVLSIWIAPNEGGGCETEGGMPLLIVSAGYLGSMFFGGMILYLSRLRGFVPVVYGMLTLVLGAATMTVLKDSYSRTFAFALAGTFVGLGFLVPGVLGGIVLRTIGTMSCLYSILDIYQDILAVGPGTSVQNDAVVFAQLSGTSPEIVGAAWLGVSVAYFLVVLKVTLSGAPAGAPAVKSPQPATG